jgi:hypothetical protein
MNRFLREYRIAPVYKVAAEIETNKFVAL